MADYLPRSRGLRRGRAAAPARDRRPRAGPRPRAPRPRHSAHNLAWLYQDMGRHAEAEPLYRRALAIREQALGPEHPDVAEALGCLGLVLPGHRPPRRGRAAHRARPRHLRADHRPRPPRPRPLALPHGLALPRDRPPRRGRAALPARILAIRSRPSAPSTPTSPNLSAAWPGSTGPPAATPRPSRSSSARSPSGRRPSAPSTPTCPLAQQPGLALPGHRPPRRGRAAAPARAGHPRAKPSAPSTRRRSLAQQPGRALPGHRPPRRGRAALRSARSPSASKTLGPEHPDLATWLDNLARLYRGYGQSWRTGVRRRPDPRQLG